MNVRILITRDGSNAVKVMDIEEYLRGVVSREMSESWPLEALKAQAVCARTYALAHITNRGAYDMDDTTKFQAYVAPTHAQPNVDAAVKATAGEVLFYQKELITAYYTAANGGHILSTQEVWGGVRPYSVSKDDKWDGTWCMEHGLTIKKFDDGWYLVDASGKKVKKAGHRTGMSQLGAKFAAEHGTNYKTILNFYFHDCVITENYGKPLPPPYIIHVVAKGESLIKIAGIYQKKGYKVTWTMIAKANAIKLPWIIHPGQKLKIPNIH